MNNYMKLEIPSKTTNEAFARAAVGAFAAQVDLTIEELSDIKTAVSEAVTNSIIHGYKDASGVIFINCNISCKDDKYTIEIVIEDKGKGIEDIDAVSYTHLDVYKRQLLFNIQILFNCYIFILY